MHVFSPLKETEKGIQLKPKTGTTRVIACGWIIGKGNDSALIFDSAVCRRSICDDF